MTIQEVENQFYELYPNSQNRMVKTSIIFDVTDNIGNKVPLEAYTVMKTLESVQAMIERQTDASNNVYYDAYPGELISVVMDTSSNNGVYLVLGTQDPSQNGLSLHKLAYE